MVGVSDLSGMTDRLRYVGDAPSSIGGSVISIALRSRQDLGADSIITAELIKFAAGSSAHRLKSHQWTRALRYPHKRIRGKNIGGENQKTAPYDGTTFYSDAKGVTVNDSGTISSQDRILCRTRVKYYPLPPKRIKHRSNLARVPYYVQSGHHVGRAPFDQACVHDPSSQRSAKVTKLLLF